MKLQHQISISKTIKLLFISTIVILTIIYAPLSYSQEHQEKNEFELLKQGLIDYGFTVKLAIPPYQNKYGIKPYGLLESQTKTIWINPIVFELGNAKSTLIHETTHAAQLCAGKGQLGLLRLDIQPPKITHPYFMRYHNYRREIEAEAYTVQVQDNSLELANQLLSNYCNVIE